MNARTLTVGFVSLALLAGAAVWALAQPAGQPPAPAKSPEKEADEAGEQVIDLAKAPEPVRAAAIKLAGSERAVKKVIKEEDEGVSTYEVEYTAEGVDCSAVVSTAGDVMELEKGTTEAKLPAAALAALKKDYPKATFASPLLVTKMFYEVEVVIDGKKHEVKVDAAGNIEDEKGGDGMDHTDAKGEDHKKGEKHEGKKNEKDEDEDDDND